MHIFPQAKRFEKFWKNAGIDIDEFTVKIPPNHHSLLHGQGDNAFPGGVWNAAWDEFFEKDPTAGKKEILKFAAELMTKYGLSGYAIRPYK